MTLAELTTPFERRRMIEYGTDGCKVVRHWYEVQHVIGSLYKSRETRNEYGEVEFSLFILFDKKNDGILFQYAMKHPEWYTIEKMENDLVKYGYDTVDNFMAMLDGCMQEGRFIGNAMIEFARQFKSDKAEQYSTYRSDYLAKREAAERQRKADEKAAEEKEQAEKEAILQAEKAKYLGWADNMTNMRFGRVSAILEKCIRVDGKVLTKREFIISLLKNGYIPEEKSGVTSYYGSRWDRKESKPRTEYWMSLGNIGYTVNKTEYDFAVFLTSKVKQEVKESA